MSFLSAFVTILHAAEAAAKIAAPIVQALYPVEGALLAQAVNAAVAAEAVIPAPNSGEQKAALVRSQTTATIDVINGILAGQNRPPLANGLADRVEQNLKAVISGLNTVAQAVGPNPPAVPAGTPPK